MKTLVVGRDTVNGYDTVSFGPIASFLAASQELSDLHSTLSTVAIASARVGVEMEQQGKILQPEPLRAKVRQIVADYVAKPWRVARLAAVKAKQDNIDYDHNRSLIVPAEPSVAGVARNVEYRAWLRNLSRVQQIEHLLNATATQLDAIMEPGVRELIGFTDDQVWQRIASRYRDLAHERFVRKTINDPKPPSLSDIAPLGADEDKILKITESAIAQRQRRINDVDNAERFLSQFVAVIAAALEIQPNDALEFLLDE